MRSSAIQLIETLRQRGITDERVLSVMVDIDRARFVPEELEEFAWEDRALPIEAGQTISQPYIVALMTEALRLTGVERVLEVGTGSGYQTAILAQLSREVFTVERHADLLKGAQDLVLSLGVTNVDFRIGDGSLGLPEAAPFDAILVAAGSAEIPPGLLSQLATPGRLVIPCGDDDSQSLEYVEKTESGVTRSTLCECRFVPLISSHT